MKENALPDKVEGRNKYLVIMNEAAMKAFGYTKRDEAFVRRESTLDFHGHGWKYYRRRNISDARRSSRRKLLHRTPYCW